MKVYIGPYPDEGERDVQVELHDYDTYNADETLSLIILPVLKALRDEKCGTPITAEADAPQFPDDRETDEFNRGFNEDRWKFILNEMIWAFEQNVDPDNDDRFWTDTGVPAETGLAKRLGLNEQTFDKEGWKAHDARIQNGLRLFGTYFRSLWT